MSGFRRISCLLLSIIFVAFLTTESIAQTLLVSPSEPYMGKIPVGSKAVRVISIYNLGTKTLNITSISLANNTQFKLLNNPGTKSLGLLESLNLELEYSPAATGLLETELTLVSNAAGSPNKYKITGYGTGGQNITFERIFGGPESDGASVCQQTDDGGYLLAGSTTLPNQDYSDFYLVKTDKYGAIQWTHSYGDQYGEGLSSALMNSDGSIIVYGTKQPILNGTNDIYFAKLNSDRTVAWEKKFGGADEENAGSFLALSNGDYLIVGTSRSFGTSTQIHLLRVDKNGNLVWEKNLGGSNGETGKKIIPTKDGNYIIAGSTSSKGAGNYDAYLVKIDANGNQIWDKTFGGPEYDEANDIDELPDGSFVISGSTVSYGVNGYDMYLLKVDASGNLVWQKTFGGNYQDYGGSVRAVSDGIVMSGTLQVQIPPQTNNDALIIKTDMSGNEIWRFQSGGSQSEGGGRLLIAADGNIVMGGSTDSYSSKSDVYFLDVNASGKITRTENDNEKLPTDIALLQNYPNPFNNQTVITYILKEQSFIELSLFNILGEKLAVLEKGEMSSGIHRVDLNTDKLSSGIYFGVLKSEFGILVNKMILLK